MMKNQKYYTVGTVPKSSRKIIGRGKTDAPTCSTQVHDLSLSWLGTHGEYKHKAE